MNIRSATYLKALVPDAPLPDQSLPIVAFLGRSNVGKSSFINALTEQKNLCRSGSTPGVTQKINLFLINNKILFADLPGYGYAKMGKGERKRLEAMIFWFLENRQINLQQVFLLIDARLGATDQDEELIGFLLSRNLPLVLILSKSDKLTHSEKLARAAKIRLSFPHIDIIHVSAQKGDGLKEVRQKILPDYSA